MAKIRSISNPMRTGGQGDTTYYVKGGEQITRQRRNNSNYGESASRTIAQQSNRARWANVVNFFKACSAWMPKAFEKKSRAQSDYNVFMQLNAASSPYYLMKSQAAADMAIPYNYFVSKGSLPTVALNWNPSQDNFDSDIKLSISLTSSTTIAAFSSDVVANNNGYELGDNIGIVTLFYFTDSADIVHLLADYEEITLSSADSRTFSQFEFERFLGVNTSGYLTVSPAGGGNWIFCGCTFIHTRKGTRLKVSTQQMKLVPPIDWSMYSSDAQKQRAIDSYGLTPDAPLEPGS